MKLLKIICFLVGALSAIRIPNVGLSQESYLELTRKYSYLQLMKNLLLASRKNCYAKNKKSNKLQNSGLNLLKQCKRNKGLVKHQKETAGESKVKEEWIDSEFFITETNLTKTFIFKLKKGFADLMFWLYSHELLPHGSQLTR